MVSQSRRTASKFDVTEISYLGLVFCVLVACWSVPSMAQVSENIDRGPVALAVNERAVYVGWRLLKEDPESIAFNVYRKDMGLSDFQKVNQTPISGSTNFLDTTSSPGHGYKYKIKTVSNGLEHDTRGEAYVFTLSGTDQVGMLQPVLCLLDRVPVGMNIVGKTENTADRVAGCDHQRIVLRDEQVFQHGHAAEQTDILKCPRDLGMLRDQEIRHPLKQENRTFG